jgi:hypothetical protein
MKEDIWRQSADAWLLTIEHGIADVMPPMIAGLRAAEQFVLCNIRLWWSGGVGEGPCARALVRNGFVAVNLPPSAHDSFDQFMSILIAAAQPRPAIHATQQRDLGDDEARLLSAVSLCQQGHNGHAIMVLKRWLPPTAYRVSLKNLVAFAGLAAAQGLILPVRVTVPASALPVERRGPRYLVH